jgi:hypothetical protein
MRKIGLSSLALLLATNGAFSQAPPIGQGGAAPGPPFVARGGHIYASGPAPTIDPTCIFVDPGFTHASGSDVVGYVYPRNTWAVGTPCKMTFAIPWDVVPACILFGFNQMGQPSPNLSYTLQQNAAGQYISITFYTTVAPSGMQINYWCFGVPP